VFAIVMVFGLGAVAAIGQGFAISKRRDDEQPNMRRLPAPDRPMGGGPGERAEQIAARIAMIDRTTASASVYSSREVFTRRTGEIADAVASAPLLTSDRLGQAYSRAPRPTRRRGED
jgi:hypothetical protein